MMSAPSCASRTACERPCPRAAPVMKATLPATLAIVAPHIARISPYPSIKGLNLASGEIGAARISGVKADGTAEFGKSFDGQLVIVTDQVARFEDYPLEC